jgi:hypothetical protein
VRQFILTEVDGDWYIQQTDLKSIYPTTKKSGERAMIARLMQLLDVGPLSPQLEPESIKISEPSLNPFEPDKT